MGQVSTCACTVARWCRHPYPVRYCVHLDLDLRLYERNIVGERNGAEMLYTIVSVDGPPRRLVYPSKVAQIRLGTARLTHCMRWTGMAKRALEETFDYVREREAFGDALADHEGVQWLLGEAAMQIEIGRLLTMRAAVKLDSGDFARKEVSMAKVMVSETLHKAIDTAIQLRGARGYSKDTPLEWMYRYARQARLVDGSSETHKMVLSRHLLAEGINFWSWVSSSVSVAP